MWPSRDNTRQLSERAPVYLLTYRRPFGASVAPRVRLFRAGHPVPLGPERPPTVRDEKQLLGKEKSNRSIEREGTWRRSVRKHRNGQDGISHPKEAIRSLIPARLDRLGWSRFHTRLVVALGVAWVLDGLEITIASNADQSDQREAGAQPLVLGGGLRRRHRLPARGGGRRAVLRSAVGQVGPAQPLHDHPRRLPLRRGLTALTFGHSPRLGLLAVGLAGSSPAWASAVSTRPSTRPSTS